MSGLARDLGRRKSEDGPQTSKYPPPLIIEPTSDHRESWIILHGRGDEADTFAGGYMGILNMIFPDGRTIQQHLPHVRFVFPTASHRRARVFDYDTITQWFDIYLWSSTERTEWQVQGLRETSAWISELVRRESEAIGAHNVVVGGLSQGCASVLIWNLLQGEVKIKCIFGMSGWLPFRHVLEQYLSKDQKSDQSGESVALQAEDGNADPYMTAVKALCLELEVKPAEANFGQNTPILIAHGGADEKVDIELGRQASRCLRGFGCDVQWNEYSTLKHWFHGRELMDIVHFASQVGRSQSQLVANEVDSKS